MQYFDCGTAQGNLVYELLNYFLVTKLLGTQKRKSLKLQIQTCRDTGSKHGCLVFMYQSS